MIHIGVADKDHVTGTVGDSVIGVCGDIIQELLYRFVGGFRGRGLLMSNFSQCDYELDVHSLGVV